MNKQQLDDKLCELIDKAYSWGFNYGAGYKDDTIDTDRLFNKIKAIVYRLKNKILKEIK